MAKSFLNDQQLPRGLRNNNPGNLRPGEPWKGIIGTDDNYLVFENIGYGIRAMGTDIANDIRIKRLVTIQQLINEFAPPSDSNPTSAYISAVSKATGFSSNQRLPETQDTIFRLLRAMINFELGGAYAGYITDSDIRGGMAMMNAEILNYFDIDAGDNVAAALVIFAAVAIYIFRKQLFNI